MEFEAFGKTFRFGGKEAEPEAPKTEEELADEVQNFEFIADIATVNAIPEDIRRKYKVRGVAKKQGMIVGGVIVIFGLLWVGSNMLLALQTEKVKTLNEQSQTLQQESDALSPYQDYRDALDNKRNVLSSSTQTDINYGEIYDLVINAATATQITFSSVGISQFAEEGEVGSCVSPDPLNQTEGIIGCVSLVGTTPSDVQLLEFLTNLKNQTTVENGFVLPSIASFTNENNTGSSAINMSVFFTSAFYSEKYSDLLLPLEEIISTSANNETAVQGDQNPQSMTFEEQMMTLAVTVSNEIAMPDQTADLEALASIATEVCQTNEVSATQTMMDEILPTVNATQEQIIETIRGNC